MKVYKVHLGYDHDAHRGYSYHTSKSEADKDIRENKEFDAALHDTFELRLGKVEVLAALNQHGAHRDNG